MWTESNCCQGQGFHTRDRSQRGPAPPALLLIPIHFSDMLKQLSSELCQYRPELQPGAICQPNSRL